MTSTKLKARLMVVVAAIMFLLVIYNDEADNLAFANIFYLAKNSINEFKQQVFPKFLIQSFSNDIDYPLNNMVNSVFPIDSVIQVNYTKSEKITHDNDDNIITQEFLGRYASFSPILNNNLETHYKVLLNNACTRLNDMKDFKSYENKILIVLRGDCTFVEKVDNILKSDLNPKCIIIANDEPMKGLITMYSSSFNEDRSIRTPIMFITYESYKFLKSLNDRNLIIRISTASLGNWINILLSMILSPPLLIIIFYCLIQLIQNCRRLQKNKFSEKIVKKLPVYIFNKNHLIYSKNFFNYLNITGQTNDAINHDLNSAANHSPLNNQGLNSSSSSLSSNSSIHNIDISNAKPTPSSSNPALNNFTINGIDVKKLKDKLNVLIMHDDFYPAFKCSICLDKFKPLKSRILILDCKHFFHENCLSNWLINFKRSCPLCNHSIISTTSNHNLLAGQVNNYGSLNDLDLEAQIIFDSSDNEVQESIGSLESHPGLYSRPVTQDAEQYQNPEVIQPSRERETGEQSQEAQQCDEPILSMPDLNSQYPAPLGLINSIDSNESNETFKTPPSTFNESTNSTNSNFFITSDQINESRLNNANFNSDNSLIDLRMPQQNLTQPSSLMPTIKDLSVNVDAIFKSNTSDQSKAVQPNVSNDDDVTSTDSDNSTIHLS